MCLYSVIYVNTDTCNCSLQSLLSTYITSCIYIIIMDQLISSGLLESIEMLCGLEKCLKSVNNVYVSDGGKC